MADIVLLHRIRYYLGGGGPGAQPEHEVAQVVGGDVHGYCDARPGPVNELGSQMTCRGHY